MISYYPTAIYDLQRNKSIIILLSFSHPLFPFQKLILYHMRIVAQVGLRRSPRRRMSGHSCQEVSCATAKPVTFPSQTVADTPTSLLPPQDIPEGGGTLLNLNRTGSGRRQPITGCEKKHGDASSQLPSRPVPLFHNEACKGR